MKSTQRFAMLLWEELEREKWGLIDPGLFRAIGQDVDDEDDDDLRLLKGALDVALTRYDRGEYV